MIKESISVLKLILNNIYIIIMFITNKKKGNFKNIKHKYIKFF